jgi:hypothetical protein
MSIDRLHTREIGLGIVLLLGILMFATTGSTGTNGTHEMIEWFGIFAILLCYLRTNLDFALHRWPKEQSPIDQRSLFGR